MLNEKGVYLLRLKSCIAIAALVLMLVPSAFAKELGTPVALPQWGTVMIPDNIYITEGTQAALTAQRRDNDISRIADNLYPITPRSYQVVQKDGAVFQYGVILHYSTTIYDLQALTGQSDFSQVSLKNRRSGSATLDPLVTIFNDRFQNDPPEGLRLIQPVAKVKHGRHVFYEGTLGHDLVVNNADKTELIRLIAWQHDGLVEIAAVVGDSYNEDGIITNLANMLENVKSMRS